MQCIRFTHQYWWHKTTINHAYKLRSKTSIKKKWKKLQKDNNIWQLNYRFKKKNYLNNSHQKYNNVKYEQKKSLASICYETVVLYSYDTFQNYGQHMIPIIKELWEFYYYW